MFSLKIALTSNLITKGKWLSIKPVIEEMSSLLQNDAISTSLISHLLFTQFENDHNNVQCLYGTNIQ